MGGQGAPAYPRLLTSSDNAPYRSARGPPAEAGDGGPASRTLRRASSEGGGELAEDGVLCVSNHNGEPIYRYRPRPEYIDAIFRLTQSYNEPIERDAIQRALREVASYATYRRAMTGGTAFEMQTI